MVHALNTWADGPLPRGEESVRLGTQRRLVTKRACGDGCSFTTRRKRHQTWHLLGDRLGQREVALVVAVRLRDGREVARERVALVADDDELVDLCDC